MTDALVVKALVTYPFRDPRPGESEADYRAALIKHVDNSDYAMAQELRVGRVQADWTPEDVAAFQTLMLAKRVGGPPQAPTWVDFPMLEMGRVDSVNDTQLMVTARGLVKYFKDRRTRDPKGVLPIAIHALLYGGQLLGGFSGRGERFEIVRGLVRQLPVFGFIVIADAFMHEIAADNTTATKTDAFIVHVGSRTLRHMTTYPYRIKKHRVMYEAPREMDKGALGTDVDDPWADVFALPSAERPQ